MSQRKEEIADLMTREMGKPLQETRGDVQEGIDTAYYDATEGRRLFGHTVPTELRAKWAMRFRRPIGVCGLVTPFNFPNMVPNWTIPNADRLDRLPAAVHDVQHAVRQPGPGAREHPHAAQVHLRRGAQRVEQALAHRLEVERDGPRRLAHEIDGAELQRADREVLAGA